MRITVERKALAAALAVCKRHMGRGPGLPILVNARLELHGDRVLVSATDLETAVSVELPGSADGPGVVLFPILEALEAVKGKGGADTVVLETGGDSEAPVVRLEAGPVSVVLPAPDPEEYPVVPAGLLEGHYPASATDGPRGSVLVPEARALAAVSHAMSTDETRFNLNGVFLEAGDGSVRWTATDGHRLATAAVAGTWPVGDRAGAILPPGFVIEMGRMVKPRGASGSVSVWTDGPQCFAQFGPVVVTGRLIDGTYPNWRQVVPEGNSLFAYVEPVALAAACKRVEKCSRHREEHGKVLKPRTGAVKLTLNGALEVFASDQDGAEALETVPADFEGPDTVLGVNGRYLRDALEAIGTGRVQFRMAAGTDTVDTGPRRGEKRASAAVNPLRLEAIGSPVVAVVMPVRL